jgi:2,3,4,5-tetrahydropyridine-2-carboxylate N-succinyltransferase
MPPLARLIDSAFDNKDNLSAENAPAELKQAIEQTLAQVNRGELRVASPAENGGWTTHEWIKKAILLHFKLTGNAIMPNPTSPYFAQVALKYADYTAADFAADQVRVVPPATARYGAYIGKNTILMPSYVNLGAYIDTGTLIDTWATVGSCAQIGKNVHISGGVGIGGVLEPLQANPTIIEDGCFIGARSEIVEGVVVQEGAVISMGVYIGQSTPIYNRMTDTITYGTVPPYAVVIPGSLPDKGGKYARYAAIIMKIVDESTRQKTSLNALLRD